MRVPRLFGEVEYESQVLFLTGGSYSALLRLLPMLTWDSLWSSEQLAANVQNDLLNGVVDSMPISELLSMLDGQRQALLSVSDAISAIDTCCGSGGDAGGDVQSDVQNWLDSGVTETVDYSLCDASYYHVDAMILGLQALRNVFPSSPGGVITSTGLAQSIGAMLMSSFNVQTMIVGGNLVALSSAGATIASISMVSLGWVAAAVTTLVAVGVVTGDWLDSQIADLTNNRELYACSYYNGYTNGQTFGAQETAIDFMFGLITKFMGNLWKMLHDPDTSGNDCTGCSDQLPVTLSGWYIFDLVGDFYNNVPDTVQSVNSLSVQLYPYSFGQVITGQQGLVWSGIVPENTRMSLTGHQDAGSLYGWVAKYSGDSYSGSFRVAVSGLTDIDTTQYHLNQAGDGWRVSLFSSEPVANWRIDTTTFSVI